MYSRFKFRVWDSENKKMHDDDFIITSLGKVHKPTVASLEMGEIKDNPDELAYRWLKFDQAENNFDKLILMQCTGLKDKNDRLIYEGDIIYKKGTKNYKGQKMYSEVIWDQMYAEFNISDDNGLHRMPSNSNNIEIIGNIFENPKLLQGDDNV